MQQPIYLNIAAVKSITPHHPWAKGPVQHRVKQKHWVGKVFEMGGAGSGSQEQKKAGRHAGEKILNGDVWSKQSFWCVHCLMTAKPFTAWYARMNSGSQQKGIQKWHGVCGFWQSED